MATILRIPKLGSTMTSATVNKWYKKEGDAVKVDEPVLAVETDKISNDIVSPVDGYLLKILVNEDEERGIGVSVCIIGQPDENTDQEDIGNDI